MADEELIRNLIEGGVEWWNTTREEVRNRPFDHRVFDPVFFGDFSQVNFWWAFRDYGSPDQDWPISLAGIDLVEAFLDHTMLRLVDLTDADLYGAFVREANLRETKLVDADIRDADLQGASLSKADLSGADLRGADLKRVNLRGARLTNADLTTANLIGADLSHSKPWKALLFPKPCRSLSQASPPLEPIGSITDLLEACRTIKNHHDTQDESNTFYFRGEPKCGWELKPSVMRGSLVTAERDMLLDLMARRPEEFAGFSSSLGQWVLAQHHGLKTRFLDVTKNPLVALFHATEEEEYRSEDGRLHMFAVPREMVKPFNSDTVGVIANFAKLSHKDQDLLLGKEVPLPERGHRRDQLYQATMERLCQLIQEEKPYFQNRIDIRDFFRVIVVEPQETIERLRVQSGAFLASAFHVRFEQEEITSQVSNLPVYAHYMVTIPYEQKLQIMEELHSINIRRESLFPGLDEAATGITHMYENTQN